MLLSVPAPGPASIELRAATQADVPFLLALRLQTMTPHLLASGVAISEPEQLARVLFRFECAQVVEHAGKPIGIFKLTRDGLDWALVQLQVMPELQSRGIGTELVQRAIAEAHAAGARLRLNVLHTNPARHLYERLGFRIESDGAHEFVMLLSDSGKRV